MGLLSSAPPCVLQSPLSWGGKSQKTLGEWNFRNGKSELVPAWSSCLGLAEVFGYAFRLLCSHNSLLKFSVLFLSLKDYFIVLLRFFFLCTKY